MPPNDARPGLDLSDRHFELLQGLFGLHLAAAEVWAFGSRVKGGAHEGSDLDLVVRHSSDPSLRVAGTGRLREALQNSALPMRVEVHDWADLQPSFRAEIERCHFRLAVL